MLFQDKLVRFAKNEKSRNCTTTNLARKSLQANKFSKWTLTAISPRAVIPHWVQFAVRTLISLTYDDWTETTTAARMTKQILVSIFDWPLRCVWRSWWTEVDFKGFNLKIRCRVSHSKCDQMVRLFFKIWPFATMKISPLSQICQSILSNKK